MMDSGVVSIGTFQTAAEAEGDGKSDVVGDLPPLPLGDVDSCIADDFAHFFEMVVRCGTWGRGPSGAPLGISLLSGLKINGPQKDIASFYIEDPGVMLATGECENVARSLKTPAWQHILHCCSAAAHALRPHPRASPAAFDDSADAASGIDSAAAAAWMEDVLSNSWTLLGLDRSAPIALPAHNRIACEAGFRSAIFAASSSAPASPQTGLRSATPAASSSSPPAPPPPPPPPPQWQWPLAHPRSGLSPLPGNLQPGFPLQRVGRSQFPYSQQQLHGRNRLDLGRVSASTSRPMSAVAMDSDDDQPGVICL